MKLKGRGADIGSYQKVWPFLTFEFVVYQLSCVYRTMQVLTVIPIISSKVCLAQAEFFKDLRFRNTNLFSLFGPRRTKLLTPDFISTELWTLASLSKHYYIRELDSHTSLIQSNNRFTKEIKSNKLLKCLKWPLFWNIAWNDCKHIDWSLSFNPFVQIY